MQVRGSGADGGAGFLRADELRLQGSFVAASRSFPTAPLRPLMPECCVGVLRGHWQDGTGRVALAASSAVGTAARRGRVLHLFGASSTGPCSAANSVERRRAGAARGVRRVQERACGLWLGGGRAFLEGLQAGQKACTISFEACHLACSTAMAMAGPPH